MQHLSFLPWDKVLLALAALTVPASAADWITGFPRARKIAEQENKLILADFTGSDWCTFCIQLRKEILDNPDFLQIAEPQFVFLEVDLPKRTDFDTELRKHNNQLTEQYGVGGFPTVLILTPQGEVVGGFCGMLKGVDEALSRLKTAGDNAEHLKKAKQLSGAAKAKELYAVYKTLPREKSFAKTRLKLREELLACDTGNITGIQDEAAVLQQAELFAQQRRAIGNIAAPEMAALLSRQMQEALPPNRKSVLTEQCQHALATAQTEQDILHARRLFEQLILLQTEEEAAETKQFLLQFFTDPAKLLQTLKASRPR